MAMLRWSDEQLEAYHRTRQARPEDDELMKAVLGITVQEIKVERRGSNARKP